MSTPAPVLMRRVAAPVSEVVAAPAPAEEVAASEVSDGASKQVPRLDEVLAAHDAIVAAFSAQMKEQRRLIKAAITGAKKRLSPEERAAEAARTKRPVSEKVAEWNAYVATVFDELKAANPKAKRSEAMALAKARRAAGESPMAPVEAKSTGKLSEEEKAERKAARDAEREAKKAEKEVSAAQAKLSKLAEKEAAKAAKEAEKAAAKAAKEAEKEAAKAAKEAAAAAIKAAKAVSKPAAAAAKPAASSASLLAAAAAKLAAPQPEEEQLLPFTHGGKKYHRSNMDGASWEALANGGMGSWAGFWDEASKKFVKTEKEHEPSLA
jgi:hypothetical protein